jgi:hypothetical protein
MFRAISRPHLRPTSLPLLQPDEKPRMNWIKLSGFATAVAAALIAAPATVLTATPAYADCGDSDQPPCTGPVPTTDDGVAVLDKLTDPDIPAANKTDIVTPGFNPDEAGTIDDHLNRMRGPSLPLHFVVTNIQPAPNNFAGATLATVGNPRQSTFARPIVLVDQGGHWLMTHDTAMTEMYWFWQAAARSMFVP